MPASLTVDARLPASNLLLAGLWDWANEIESASAPNAPIAAHGTNASESSRVAVFAMNPLYRADPEREWPMTASAAYWIDR